KTPSMYLSRTVVSVVMSLRTTAMLASSSSTAWLFLEVLRTLIYYCPHHIGRWRLRIVWDRMALHMSVLAHQQWKVNSAPVDFDLIHSRDRYLVSFVGKRPHGLVMHPAHPVLDLWEASDRLEKRCV